MLLLALFMFVVAVGGDVLNLDSIMDVYLDTINENTRWGDASKIQTLPGALPNNNITFGAGQMLGADSWMRTGHCSLTRQDNSTTFDLHFGMRLMSFLFGNLTIDGQEMSAYLRVRNNSFHINYTAEGCKITVHDYQCEALDDVEFVSSRSEFDGYNVQAVFQQLLELENKMLQSDAPRFVQNLEALCQRGIDTSEGAGLFIDMIMGKM